ncbi:MAG: hypothetical protein AAF713_17665 [Pseudomonadota bacterium]
MHDTLRPVCSFGASLDNIICQVFALMVEGAISVIRRWIELADREGIPIQFETHWNCLTNDMFCTLGLIDALPSLPANTLAIAARLEEAGRPNKVAV